jgi:hypothetical protein
MHGQNRVRARDLHRCILAPPGGKRVFCGGRRSTGAAVPDRGGGRASCRVMVLADAFLERRASHADPSSRCISQAEA